jgi:hypothetical protein
LTPDARCTPRYATCMKAVWALSSVCVAAFLLHHAALLCTCTVESQTIAAAFSNKSPFSASLERQDELERVRRALAAPLPAQNLNGSAAAAAAALQASGITVSLPAATDAALAAAARLAAGQQSDHLLLVAAFEMWRLAGAAGGERAAGQVRGHECVRTTHSQQSDAPDAWRYGVTNFNICMTHLSINRMTASLLLFNSPV